MQTEQNSKKKNLLISVLSVVLAATLLFGGGTYAYLQGTTDEVVNDFQTNKVLVDLTETTGGDYNIVPGTSEAKDPTVKVNATVPAYVYVTVNDTTEGLVSYEIADGWTLLDGTDNVYYREVAGSDAQQEFPVLKDNTVYYDAALENSDMLDADGNLKDGIQLTFTASAMQKEPFNDAVKAYYQADAIVEPEATAAALNEAIAQADGKTVVKVKESITTDTSVVIPADKEIVLSLDEGVEIVSTKQGAHAIKNEGYLTVTGGTIDAQAHATAAIYNEVSATVELNNVTITRSLENGQTPDDNGGNSYYAVLNHGEMTLNNCTVLATGSYSSLIENGWQDGTKNTTEIASFLTINGGTFDGGINTVKNDDYGHLMINDGLFKNTTQYAVMNHNVAVINGGTFTSVGKSAVYNCACNAVMDKGILTVTGGNFDYNPGYYGIYDVDQDASTIDISGGTFVTQYISNKADIYAEGYAAEANSDGTYSVVAVPVN